MILTICPNPSIDCTMELDNLNVGMLNRISSKIETYSGKALNVAIGIARLNKKCMATGFMFNNQAKLFEHTLEKEKVDYSFIYNDGNARVNYKIIDKKSMLTEINDKGETVTKEKQNELIELIKKLSNNVDIAVMSGSLPKGVEPEFYGRALSVIPKSVKLIVDTEKENMLSALDNEIYMVKPNLRELENFANQELLTKKDMLKACGKYLDKGVKNVLLSLGAEGAILTDGTESYFCKSANVAVNSTVGAGDCMISAATVGITEGLSKKEILQMSVAAGTAAITTCGTNLFYKDKYDEIFSKILPEKI